jgi:hypothetical protein
MNAPVHFGRDAADDDAPAFFMTTVTSQVYRTEVEDGKCASPVFTHAVRAAGAPEIEELIGWVETQEANVSAHLAARFIILGIL